MNELTKPTVKCFVLLPLDAKQAVIIRRGPSKKVGLFSWNLNNNEIKVSQWLKGRVYEYLSDITDDGRYLIYAANHKGKTYTAISKAPWLKALSIWSAYGSFGGGLFKSNRQFMLFDRSDQYRAHEIPDLNGIERDDELLKDGVYPARLLRFGWQLERQTAYSLTFIKALGKDMRLETTLSYRYNTISSQSHRLIIADKIIDKPDWHWAEVVKKDLLWSANGCIYRIARSDLSLIDSAKPIHDFNTESFQALIAPY